MVRDSELIRVRQRTFLTVNYVKPKVAAAKPEHPTGEEEGHRQLVERHPLTVKENKALRTMQINEYEGTEELWR